MYRTGLKWKFVYTLKINTFIMNDIQQKILDLRREYQGTPLDEQFIHGNPMHQFERWLAEAIEAGLPEPTAMTLSTVDAAGKPSSRIVLLGGFNAEGFVFFTNYRSRKGGDLLRNPNAALLFFWHELFRQVHIEGVAERLAPAESDTYFQTRPRERQVAAWAALQSSQLKNRDELIRSFEQTEERFAGIPVARPDHWGGYRVKPVAIEFWQGMPSRLHDRLKFERRADDSWQLTRLAP